MSLRSNYLCNYCLPAAIFTALLYLITFVILHSPSMRSYTNGYLMASKNGTNPTSPSKDRTTSLLSSSGLQFSDMFLGCSKHAIICHRQKLQQTATGLQLSKLSLHSLKFLLHGMLTSLDYTCSDKHGYGKPGLGFYEICMVSNLKPKPKDCLIYSFGISNDWSFDEEMAKYGCEVHSFDPSIGLQDHQHAPNVTFHNAGIWGSDIVTSEGWKLERLSTIRKRLGHEQRNIDILKVDVEGGEWPFLRDVLYEDSNQLTTVKQIVTELHAPRLKHETVTKRDYLEMIISLQDLKKMDFEIFKNFHDGNCCGAFASFMPAEVPERCCQEIALINTRFI